LRQKYSEGGETAYDANCHATPASNTLKPFIHCPIQFTKSSRSFSSRKIPPLNPFFDKNSLQGELNIRKKELYVKKKGHRLLPFKIKHASSKCVSADYRKLSASNTTGLGRRGSPLEVIGCRRGRVG